MNKENLKVIFGCNSYDGTILDGCLFQHRLIERLEEHGITTIGIVTHFREVKDYFDKAGIPCHNLQDFRERYPVKNLEEELREIEERYGTSVEQIMTGDFDQDHSDRRKAEETMLSTFRFWEDVIDNGKPDYIIAGGERFISLVGHAVCKKKDTVYLSMTRAPFPKTFCFTRDVRGHMTTLDNYWRENSERELTPEERKKAEEYINSIITHEKKDEAFNLYDTTPRVNTAKLRFFLDRAYKSFFIERLRSPYSKPWRGLYNYILRIARSRTAKLLYDRPREGERYLFFPLHVEWDSPILVWNPLYINQLFLIKIISRNLPYGVRLYVKEHPCDTGGTPLGQLRRIRNTRNVKLIEPGTDSFELIKNSEAVLVIGGSVGWECLLFGKQVINVGRAYYETCGLTWKTGDLSKLDDVIKDAIKGGRYDREVFLRFVSAFMKVSYTGKIGFTQLYYGNESNRDEVLSDENMEGVAAGINKQLREDAHLLEWDCL